MQTPISVSFDGKRPWWGDGMEVNHTIFPDAMDPESAFARGSDVHISVSTSKGTEPDDVFTEGKPQAFVKILSKRDPISSLWILVASSNSAALIKGSFGADGQGPNALIWESKNELPNGVPAPPEGFLKGLDDWLTRTFAATALNKSAFFNADSGDRYEVGALIGSGGTAVVHEVHNNDGQIFAAKALSGHRFPVDEQMRLRFDREARHLAKISHPNVIRAVDLAGAARERILIMELAGKSLYEYLKSHSGPQDLPTVRSWLRQLLNAVSALHNTELVHRDITPRNIFFMTEDPSVLKLGDFGTVRNLNDETLTVAGTPIGSLIYIAPEQFENPHTVDWRADLFSIGQIGLELLTGTKPIGNPPPASKSRPNSEGLSELIDRLRAHKKNERPTIGEALSIVI